MKNDAKDTERTPEPSSLLYAVIAAVLGMLLGLACLLLILFLWLGVFQLEDLRGTSAALFGKFSAFAIVGLCIISFKSAYDDPSDFKNTLTKPFTKKPINPFSKYLSSSNKPDGPPESQFKDFFFKALMVFVFCLILMWVAEIGMFTPSYRSTMY